MKQIKILLMVFVLLCLQCFADQDPRLYDVCLVIQGGHVEVVKNSKGEDIDEIFRMHDLNTKNNLVVLIKNTEQGFNIKKISLLNNHISYRVNPIPNQDIIYKIAVDDFKKYITGKSKWLWNPEYYYNRETKEAMRLVPRLQE